MSDDVLTCSVCGRRAPDPDSTEAKMWEGVDALEMAEPVMCPNHIADRDDELRPIDRDAILRHSADATPGEGAREDYVRVDGEGLLAAFAAEGRSTNLEELGGQAIILGGFVERDGEHLIAVWLPRRRRRSAGVRGPA